MSGLLWYIPAFLVFIGILILSTVLSIPIQVEGVGFMDKLSHIFAYMVLAITTLFALYKNGILGISNWIKLVIACSIYGVLLEFLQYSLFPNRYFEWLDASSNVAGALVGSAIFRLFKNVKKEG